MTAKRTSKREPAGRASGPSRPLTGTVAVVAGATRGAGRGIARALGEAGATVYCTGRSVKGRPSPYKRRETSESPLFVGRAVAALAADPNVLTRTGQLLSSWELSREYGFTDYDGRRPDWGQLTIDWSVLPPSLIELFRIGTDLELAWLTTLAERTRRFRDKLPARRLRDRAPGVASGHSKGGRND